MSRRRPERGLRGGTDSCPGAGALLREGPLHQERPGGIASLSTRWRTRTSDEGPYRGSLLVDMSRTRSASALLLKSALAERVRDIQWDQRVNFATLLGSILRIASRIKWRC